MSGGLGWAGMSWPKQVVKPGDGGADGQTGETRLGDGTVDDSLLAEAVEQTLGDLVSV